MGLGVSLEGGSPWKGGLLGGGISLEGVSLGSSLAGGSPWRGVFLEGGFLGREGGLLGSGGSPCHGGRLGRGSPWQGGLPGIRGCIPACTEVGPPC